ncbi:MAG: putative transposase y4qJ [Gammaproteobacteria bacterium]|nr:putative transposase y4qJ [Gammaproteobacteria bacterium]
MVRNQRSFWPEYAFLLHVLPQGLQRIRYYGLLGNRHRQEKLAQCRELLQMELKTPAETDLKAPCDYRDRYEALTGVSLHQCPVCRGGRMVTVEQITRPIAQPPILDTS